MRIRKALALLTTGFLIPACGGGPTSPGGDGPAIQLSANIVDPLTVNAVSQFNACVGHAFPQPSSPNSAKNYFWPNSTNFSTTDQLPLYAACDGTVSQNSNDTNDPTSTRGAMFHLWCDGSSTGSRYFHVNMAAGLVGRHVRAGDALGFAAMLDTGQARSSAWQFSSNFDVAVVEKDDSATVNYFAKLTSAAFSAWASRGLTSVAQTNFVAPSTCSSYSSNVGQPGILSFTPTR